MNSRKIFLTVGACLLLNAGCGGGPFDESGRDTIDPQLGLSREDYRHINDPAQYTNPDNPDKQLNPAEPPVPELADILAAPQPPKIAASKLVSVAVTDDVPLKDVLIELARLADVDIEVDAGITGGVSFRAKDRPFNEVVERIADLAGLRYKMRDGVLRIERDTPYVQTYDLNFLNIKRESSSKTSISTNVLSSGVGGSSGGGSSGGGGGGGGLTTGSTTSLDSKSESDFWDRFSDGIKQIMDYVPASRVSSTSVATQPAQAQPQFDENGQPVPIAATAAAAAPTSSGGTFFVLNRQAGTLTVSGTQQQHEMITKFVEKVEHNTSSQVLIEAKIVEVTLNDKFQSGIDWSQLGGSKVSLPFTFGAVDDPANVATFNLKQQNIGGWSLDIDAAVQLTQLFGTTRTLSSPRLHAMNNQQAVLTFAENIVYFQLDIQRESNTSTGGTTTDLNVTSTLNTVPIGIILTLQPSINMETNEVTLSVRPTLSRVTTFVNDPAVSYLITQIPAGTPTAGLISPIPVVEVRELDSILKLQSGQVMVIGGLMEDDVENTDRGIPWASEVPYVGNLFKGIDKDRRLKELVIFIRATIVGSHGNAHPMDKAVYEKFTDDPRPLSF